MTTKRRRETPALAEAFERLVRSHRSEIFRTVFRLSRNREDAEDLTQITFLNAYAALQRGAQPEAPRAWLHAIARNAGSRRYHQRRLVEVELDEETSGAIVDDDVPTLVELQAALAQLTLNQRAALLMREVGGLSAREIAARLGISPGAVATLLFRARRALRAELEGTPQGRPVLGGLSVLATALRSAWLRLLGPVADGSELLTRSGAVAGVAAATSGLALLTTSAVPLPARADHSIVVAAPHATAAISVRAAPRVRVARLVAVPKQVRGAAHVAAAVTTSKPRHADGGAPATAPRVRGSTPHSTPTGSASATDSASDRAAAGALAPAEAGPEGSAPSPRPATAGNSAPAAGPAAQAQAVVTSATQSPTQAVTQAVTQVVTATTPVTSVVPSAPAVTTPAVTTPAVTTPTVTTPTVTTQTVTTPTVTTPTVTTPTVTTPAVTTPTVTTSTVTTPAVTTPTVTTPTVTTPAVTTPTVTTPTVTTQTGGILPTG